MVHSARTAKASTRDPQDPRYGSLRAIAGFTTLWWTASIARTASGCDDPPKGQARPSPTRNAEVRHEGHAHGAAHVNRFQTLGRGEDAAVIYSAETERFRHYLTYALVRQRPLRIDQIGKAFRNEITPGNFTFRTREFEQREAVISEPGPTGSG